MQTWSYSGAKVENSADFGRMADTIGAYPRPRSGESTPGRYVPRSGLLRLEIGSLLDLDELVRELHDIVLPGERHVGQAMILRGQEGTYPVSGNLHRWIPRSSVAADSLPLQWRGLSFHVPR